MKRVLLTGGTGFVGVNLALRLLRDGHEVHLLVRPGHATWRLGAVREHVRLHQVDLLDAGGVATEVARVRPDWVFHLAAHGAYSDQIDVERIVQTNMLGTVRLVEACLKTGFEAFVNAGSSSEYGFKDHPPAETEWLEPNSTYAVAKASATLFCRHVGQSRSVRLTTLRLYSVYGPFEEPRRLLPTLVVRGLEDRLPPLVDPAVARDFVYVDDAVEAFVLAAGRPGQEPGAVYNVGSGYQTSLREVVAIARRVLEVSAQPDWQSMPDRRWDTNVWVADPRKIQEALGWRPEHAFEAGLRRMADWFRDNPAWLEHYRDTYRQTSA